MHVIDYVTIPGVRIGNFFFHRTPYLSMQKSIRVHINCCYYETDSKFRYRGLGESHEWSRPIFASRECGRESFAVQLLEYLDGFAGAQAWRVSRAQSRRICIYTDASAARSLGAYLFHFIYIIHIHKPRMLSLTPLYSTPHSPTLPLHPPTCSRT